MFYTLANLKTPCLIVSRKKLENNISRIGEYGKKHDIRIRPHIKTHKSIYVGELQMEAGAVGISVANLGEASTFSEKDFSSIFITRTIAEENKFELLLKLSRNGLIILHFILIRAAGHSDGHRNLTRRNFPVFQPTEVTQ